MSPDEFRKYALSFPQVVEGAHHGHADFRVDKKIFATLGVPDPGHGMVRLTPAQQQHFCELFPDAFFPCNGAWGKQGCTFVNLTKIKKSIAMEALGIAYEYRSSAGG